MNDKVKGKQAVPYPELLDGFGGQIAQLIKSLSSESMKPAIMADICKTLELAFALQQLMVMMYNLQVKNYEVQMNKVVDLETKLAGYSERLNQIEAKVGKGGS